jgi:hypothetical protein
MRGAESKDILIIRSFASKARKLKHFCEVVVHFFPVSYEEHCNAFLVCVYFVDGLVVARSYTPEVRRTQRFPSFPRVSFKLPKRLPHPLPVGTVKFFQSLRSVRMQQNPENQNALDFL